MGLDFRPKVERDKESVVVRGGAEAVNEFREKTHDDHPRVEIG